MLAKRQIGPRAVGAMLVLLLCSVLGAAQSAWLDLKPLPNWNERKRAILETKRIASSELKRCAVAVRRPTLPPDLILTRQGWTLVGAAQVWGRTTMVTVAEAFDGMCRPLKYETYVFVGNRVAGTLSPGPMDSRTDGALVNVQMTNERSLTGRFVRYGPQDPLCCPSRMEDVFYEIDSDKKGNFLLVPKDKVESSMPSAPASDAAELGGAVWQWQGGRDERGTIGVDVPERYQLEFLPTGKLRVKADCNRGSGSYELKANELWIREIFTTKAFCGEKSLDGRFLRALRGTKRFHLEGDVLQLETDNGSLLFSKAARN